MHMPTDKFRSDPNSIEKEIIAILADIEKQHEIKILWAVESGSRSWGFESPDSDYDIRFVYANRLEWYLSIKEKGML